MPNNTLAARSNKTSFSVYMTNDAVKQQISNVVGKNADKFITAIISAVNATRAFRLHEQFHRFGCASRDVAESVPFSAAGTVLSGSV